MNWNKNNLNDVIRLIKYFISITFIYYTLINQQPLSKGLFCNYKREYSLVALIYSHETCIDTVKLFQRKLNMYKWKTVYYVYINVHDFLAYHSKQFLLF